MHVKCFINRAEDVLKKKKKKNYCYFVLLEIRMQIVFAFLLALLSAAWIFLRSQSYKNPNVWLLTDVGAII